MKKNLTILISVAVIVFGVTIAFDRLKPTIQQVPVSQSQNINSTAAETPDVTFKTINGKDIKLQSLKGRAVIINFWASWCPPCVSELPDLVELADLLGEDKVVLLLVSSDLNREAIDRFISQMPEGIQERLSFEHIYMIWDEQGKITRDVFQTYQLPETILLNKDGEMVRKVVGVVPWTSDKMIEDIKQRTGL